MAPKRKKAVKNSHNTIPQDLCFAEILPRLPAKTLIRFKSISKQWNSMISSPNFANIHIKFCKHTNHLIQAENYNLKKPLTLFNLRLTRDNFQLSSFKNLHNSKIRKAFSRKIYLIGSCHGLICYYYKSRFFITNPTVEKRCSISPDPSWSLKAEPDGSYNRLVHITGFGYDSSTNDYKVVFLSRLNGCSGYLFALKKSIWKTLDMSWYTNRNTARSYDWLASSRPIRVGNPIQVKDTLHWLLEYHRSNTFTVLLTFDLAKEVLSAIDLPSIDDNIIGITRIRGCLCKVHYQSGTGKKLGRKPPRVEVQMLEKHGVWDSWQTFYVCHLGMTLSKDYLNLFEFRDDNNG